MEVFGAIFLLAFVWFYFWTGVWAYRDAKRRGKPPALVALLVLLVGWPISLLVWIALRPEGGGRRTSN